MIFVNTFSTALANSHTILVRDDMISVLQQQWEKMKYQYPGKSEERPILHTIPPPGMLNGINVIIPITIVIIMLIININILNFDINTLTNSRTRWKRPFPSRWGGRTN